MKFCAGEPLPVVICLPPFDFSGPSARKNFAYFLKNRLTYRGLFCQVAGPLYLRKKTGKIKTFTEKTETHQEILTCKWNAKVYKRPAAQTISTYNTVFLEYAAFKFNSSHPHARIPDGLNTITGYLNTNSISLICFWTPTHPHARVPDGLNSITGYPNTNPKLLI